jgi:hypothetical protein
VREEKRLDGRGGVGWRMRNTRRFLPMHGCFIHVHLVYFVLSERDGAMRFFA